jgi:hypothetical protein
VKADIEEALDSLLAELQLARAVAEAADAFDSLPAWAQLRYLRSAREALSRALAAYREGTRG